MPIFRSIRFQFLLGSTVKMNNGIPGVWILWHYILQLMTTSVSTLISVFTLTITIYSLAMLYEASTQGQEVLVGQGNMCLSQPTH